MKHMSKHNSNTESHTWYIYNTYMWGYPNVYNKNTNCASNQF